MLIPRPIHRGCRHWYSVMGFFSHDQDFMQLGSCCRWQLAVRKLGCSITYTSLCWSALSGGLSLPYQVRNESASMFAQVQNWRGSGFFSLCDEWLCQFAIPSCHGDDALMSVEITALHCACPRLEDGDKTTTQRMSYAIAGNTPCRLIRIEYWFSSARWPRPNTDRRFSSSAAILQDPKVCVDNRLGGAMSNSVFGALAAERSTFSFTQL